MCSAEPRPNRNGRERFKEFTDDELARAFADQPPILNAEQAARLSQKSKSTLYHEVSRGKYRGAVKRGKPLLFFRDRFIRALFRD